MKRKQPNETDQAGPCHSKQNSILPARRRSSNHKLSGFITRAITTIRSCQTAEKYRDIKDRPGFTFARRIYQCKNYRKVWPFMNKCHNSTKAQGNLHLIAAQEIHKLEAFNLSPCATKALWKIFLVRVIVVSLLLSVR